MRDYKTMIAPIVAVISLAIAAFTGIEIDENLQASIVSGAAILVTAGVTIYGIIKDHKKKEEK